MKKVIIIAIRYSVLFRELTRSFHLSSNQDGSDSYKNELFSPGRMEFREMIFKNLTLESLDQISKNIDKSICFRVVVMTSTELPDNNKLFLERMRDRYNKWMYLEYISPDSVNYGVAIFNAVGNVLEHNQICATARLDDDDALFSGYADVLSNLMVPENSQAIVSFSRGYNIFYSKYDKDIIGASELYQQNNSAGLAYITCLNFADEIIGNNIYECGNHTKVNEGRKTFNIDKINSFIRLNTETSDRMYRIDTCERSKRLIVEYERQSVKIDLAKLKREFKLNFLEKNIRVY